MRTYVIRSWSASNKPVDAENNYIAIEGRRQGFISWLLTLLKISPTLKLKICADTVKLSESALSGEQNRFIPLENICSTYYGYYKPWREAIILTLVMIGMSILVCENISHRYQNIFLGSSITASVIAGVLYYILNKTITMGYIENSGVTNIVAFKPSIIEGKLIDDTKAQYVVQLTQALLANKRDNINPAA